MPTPGPAPRGPGRVDGARRPRGQGGGLGRRVGSAPVGGDQALRPLQPPPRFTRMAPGRRRPRSRLRRWGAGEDLDTEPGSEAATWADPKPTRASTAGGLRREPA